MEVSRINNTMHPSFGAIFRRNNAFVEIVQCAKSKGLLLELDNALNRINCANKGEILIKHEKSNAGNYSSYFEFYQPNSGEKRRVLNLPVQDEPAVVTSLNAILNLGKLKSSFMKLVGAPVEQNISVNDMVNKYSQIII